MAGFFPEPITDTGKLVRGSQDQLHLLDGQLCAPDFREVLDDAGHLYDMTVFIAQLFGDDADVAMAPIRPADAIVLGQVVIIRFHERMIAFHRRRAILRMDESGIGRVIALIEVAQRNFKDLGCFGGITVLAFAVVADALADVRRGQPVPVGQLGNAMGTAQRHFRALRQRLGAAQVGDIDAGGDDGRQMAGCVPDVRAGPA